MVEFATQVKRRRGTTAENDAFTGAEGEITVDLEKHELRLHDGQTQGGFVIGAGGSGSGRNIGDIFYTKRTDTGLAGAVECNGGTYNTEDYEGEGSIGELLEGGLLDYISLTDYATAISTKGWCDKIGWDGGTTVRVPTLTPHIIQTNNIAVVGNGMTVGFTNGTSNAGLYCATSTTNVQIGKNMYGQPVGYSAGGTNITELASFGITTDGTKSGIIADTSDTAQLRVMFQLFNGTTDEAVATVGTVVSDVSGLKDMSNITATGKETVVGWGIPDYSAGVVVASDIADFTERTYTAPADGVVAVYLVAFNGQDAYIKINDVTVERVVGYGNGAWVNITGLYPVKKGSVIKFKDGYAQVSLIGSKGVTFYPFTK